LSQDTFIIDSRVSGTLLWLWLAILIGSVIYLQDRQSNDRVPKEIAVRELGNGV